MYNEKIKNEFLQYIAENKGYKPQRFITFFKHSEPYEAANNKDIYDLPLEGVMEHLMTQLKGISLESANIYCVNLRLYKRWALLNGYVAPELRADFIDEEVDIKRIYGDYVRKHIIRTPDELKRMLITKYPLEEPDYIITDNLIRAMYMLSYNGIEQADIFKLKTDNFIFTAKNAAIKTDDRIIEIFPAFIDEIKYLCENRTFFTPSTKQKYFPMTDRLIDTGRGYDNDRQQRVVLISISNKGGRSFNTVANTYMMGRIYYYKAFVEREGSTRKDFIKWYEQDNFSSFTKRRSIFGMYDNW